MSVDLLKNVNCFMKTNQFAKRNLEPRLVLSQTSASVWIQRCAPLMISVFQVLGVNPMMTVMTPRSVGTSSQEGARPVWGIL